MTSAPSDTIAYRACLLTPLEADDRVRYLDDALLVVEGGRITRVESFDAGSYTGPLIDLRPRLIVPGFVDTHVHFPQTRVIGSASGPLLDWLERTVFPEEARFRELSYAREVAREFVGHLLAAGTTTSSIYSSSSPVATHALFEALDAAGLRATAGLTLMDRACPPELALGAFEAMTASEQLIARWHGADQGRLTFAVTPRFALSCSRPLLEAAARLSHDRGLLMQTHIAEHPAEADAVLEVHDFAEDYLGVYEAVGLVHERSLFAHAIHFSPAAWDRLAALGAGVAHCPDSNFFLGSGRMKIHEARARGVRVGLGSDVAAGRSFDMRQAMAYAYDNALCIGERLGPDELFTMATLGGAQVLGMSDRTGSLEPGKDADFVVLRLPAHANDEARVLGLVAFSTQGRVEQVFVRGQKLYTAPGA